MQGGKPVVFEHVQQGLENMSHAEQVFKVPSSRFFQHCRDRGREFLHSYAAGLWLGAQHVSTEETPKERRDRPSCARTSQNQFRMNIVYGVLVEEPMRMLGGGNTRNCQARSGCRRGTLHSKSRMCNQVTRYRLDLAEFCLDSSSPSHISLMSFLVTLRAFCSLQEFKCT